MAADRKQNSSFTTKTGLGNTNILDLVRFSHPDLDELQLQLHEIRAVNQATEVERDRLKELVTVLEKRRVPALTGVDPGARKETPKELPILLILQAERVFCFSCGICYVDVAFPLDHILYPLLADHVEQQISLRGLHEFNSFVWGKSLMQLSEKLYCCLNRVHEATQNVVDAQNDLQTQKRRNALLEKQLGRMRVEQGSTKPGASRTLSQLPSNMKSFLCILHVFGCPFVLFWFVSWFGVFVWLVPKSTNTCRPVLFTLSLGLIAQ